MIPMTPMIGRGKVSFASARLPRQLGASGSPSLPSSVMQSQYAGPRIYQSEGEAALHYSHGDLRHRRDSSRQETRKQLKSARIRGKDPRPEQAGKSFSPAAKNLSG